MAGAVAPLRSFLFPLLVILPFLLLASRSTHGRPLLTKTNESTALLSDGLKPWVLGSEQLLRLDGKSNFFSSAEETCEQTYGVLPCTTTAVGNLFLLLVYGYLMFLAATYLSNGSEMLLVMLGPGIVGGLFLPMLGALPDAILILVSGLSGSRETAQQQVLIGMGLLAGSTVMLLTLLWGSCVVVGKCDLSDTSTLIDSQDTRRFTLQGSGIITDVQTSYAARIMVISIIPFIIMQLPKIFKMSSGHCLIIMVALVVSVGLLLSYCLYQVFQPWVLKRRLAYARHKLVKSGILKHVQALGRLLTDDGLPDSSFIKKLFYNIDADNDGVITRTELKALIIGIKFDNIDFDRDDAVEEVMKDFDTSNNNQIDEDEFRNGISRWLLDAKLPSSHSDQFRDYHSRAREEYDSLIEMNDEVVEKVDNPSWVTFKAVLLLLLGTMIAILSADPLVDAVDNFSSATSIPSFFISFIAMPLATNSSEAVSALIFASRKKKRTSSLTFSEIYGAVTMNNTLCLAVFLALVYVRQLTWDFSSEVLIILLVCVVMGLFASFRTNFPLWTACVAYILYPVSLMLVYILDYIFGWS